MQDSITPRLRFDTHTRDPLIEALKKAFIKKGYAPGLSENKINELATDDAELFVRIIEGFAEYLLDSKKNNPEPQERRKERLQSIANHLEGVVDQLKHLDDAAAEYACFIGLNELLKIDNSDHEIPATCSYEDRVEVARFKNDIFPILSAFALGIRKAERTLPFHSYNTSGTKCSWYDAPPKLWGALAMEQQFFNFGLGFTKTKTGLAAKCLRAVYTHAELDVDRVDYWLKKASDHKGSMSNFTKRQNRQGK